MGGIAATREGPMIRDGVTNGEVHSIKSLWGLALSETTNPNDGGEKPKRFPRSLRLIFIGLPGLKSMCSV